MPPFCQFFTFFSMWVVMWKISYSIYSVFCLSFKAKEFKKSCPFNKIKFYFV